MNETTKYCLIYGFLGTITLALLILNLLFLNYILSGLFITAVTVHIVLDFENIRQAIRDSHAKVG